MAPAGCFFRGVVPPVSFSHWRKHRRTRCHLNGGSGFCRFMWFRAAGCGCLRSRISRRNGCAIRVALVGPGLAERLTGLHDGQPKVFRDSAVENLRVFLERFRRFDIRSSPEIDTLVEEAQQVITGIEPQQLRDSVRLRQMVARDFEQIQASVEEMLVDRPRRNILRRGNVGGAV